MSYAPFALGGVETFIERMTRASSARGESAVVAGVSSLEGPFPNRYEGSDVEVADWSSFSAAFMAQAPPEGIEARVAGDLARWRPDVLWLNDTVDFALGAAEFLARIRPYCAIIDTLHVDPPDEGYLRRRRPYLKHVDAIVSSSRSGADRFRRELAGKSETPVAWIPYGVPAPATRREHSDDVLRLLWAARIEQPQKRALDLIPLLASLRDSGRAFRLTIAGDGPERPRLEEGLRQQGLLPFVQFEGPMPPQAIAELYARNDVLVNLSAYEGFSISVIEALAAGCVPLCTEIASLDRSVLRGGENCFLVPPGRPEIAGRILAEASGQRLREMSAAAAEAGRGMTLEKCLDGYLDVAAEARARRPIAPWPADPAPVLHGAWQIEKYNPWIPHPNPIRVLLRILLRTA